MYDNAQTAPLSRDIIGGSEQRTKVNNMNAIELLKADHDVQNTNYVPRHTSSQAYRVYGM